MPTVKKTCRVCGKAYAACHSTKLETTGFRWQEVACSPECGTEYLRQVQEARNPKPKRVKAKPVQVEDVPEVFITGNSIEEVAFDELA